VAAREPVWIIREETRKMAGPVDQLPDRTDIGLALIQGGKADTAAHLQPVALRDREVAQPVPKAVGV